MVNNIVGNNIRRIRENLNITQEELALRCDLTQGHINYIESGKRGYTKDSLARIAKALGVEISQLFEEKRQGQLQVSESFTKYGKQRRTYNDIIALLNKLPDAVVEHYKMLLKAETVIRKKGKER